MKFYVLPIVLLTSAVCFGADQGTKTIEIANKTNDAFKWSISQSYPREDGEIVVILNPLLSGVLMSGDAVKSVIDVRQRLTHRLSVSPCVSFIAIRWERDFDSCNIDLSGQLFFNITKVPYDKFTVKQVI